jgi:hypothetical protein
MSLSSCVRAAMSRPRSVLLAAVLMTAGGAVPGAATGAEIDVKILYDFKGVPDGARPSGRIVLDRQGVLGRPGAIYGVTEFGGRLCDGGANSCGAVFRLEPPRRGGRRWIETVLHRFDSGPDGKNPTAGLILDRERKMLFGTTPNGGFDHPRCFQGCGTVFALSPAEGGGWSFQSIYRFKDAEDGEQPDEIVLRDGAIFGVTRFGGFNGNLGGSAGGVFRLRRTPDGTRWTKSDVYRFGVFRSELDPAGRSPSALAFDSEGRLIVTTPRGGLVHPPESLTDMGAVYRLEAPAGGRGEWRGEILHRFSGRTDGGRPVDLFLNKQNVIFGVTALGGEKGGGTFFSLATSGKTRATADAPLIPPTVLDTIKAVNDASLAEQRNRIVAELERQDKALTDAEEEREALIISLDPISRLRDAILYAAVFDNALAARELRRGKQRILPPGQPNPPVIVRSRGSPLRELYGTTRDRGPADAGRVYSLDLP